MPLESKLTGLMRLRRRTRFFYKPLAFLYVRLVYPMSVPSICIVLIDLPEFDLPFLKSEGTHIKHLLQGGCTVLVELCIKNKDIRLRGIDFLELLYLMSEEDLKVWLESALDD